MGVVGTITNPIYIILFTPDLRSGKSIRCPFHSKDTNFNPSFHGSMEKYATYDCCQSCCQLSSKLERQNCCQLDLAFFLLLFVMLFFILLSNCQFELTFFFLLFFKLFSIEQLPICYFCKNRPEKEWWSVFYNKRRKYKLSKNVWKFETFQTISASDG